MKKQKLKLGINGFGRIGRAITRINHLKAHFDLVVINDINPDPHNLAYLLQYDTEYGPFQGKCVFDKGQFTIDGQDVKIFHQDSIDKVPWQDYNVDLVIDASGVHKNVLAAHKIIGSSVKKVIVTHSPEEVDFTMILGVNEDKYESSKHHVVSSSICDAVAAAPILKLVDQYFGIQSGMLTTLHPWLSYQNLSDGPPYSWASPGQIHYQYPLGRSAVGTLIPKPTSAISAVGKTLPHIASNIQSMSFRVPTSVVGSANLYLHLDKKITQDFWQKILHTAQKKQNWSIIQQSRDPLISVDFKKNEYSVVVDERWTQMPSPHHLFLVFWYDNEWGYSHRVVDVADHVTKNRQQYKPLKIQKKPESVLFDAE